MRGREGNPGKKRATGHRARWREVKGNRKTCGNKGTQDREQKQQHYPTALSSTPSSGQLHSSLFIRYVFNWSNKKILLVLRPDECVERAYER